MIPNKFIHIKEKESLTDYIKETISDDSLGFIADTGTIYHHGKEFLNPTWEVFEDKNAVPEIVTTLTLDQSISDPTKMVTGPLGKDGTPEDNIVTWIRSQSHRYVGNYNANDGMILKQLDDNDSTKYADGTDASIDITGANGGDVFMKMPTFWFKGVQVEANNTDKWNILFSAAEPEDSGWTKWNGNTLMGVYEAVAEDTGDNTTGNLFSRSNATPTTLITQEHIKVKARNRSNGDDHFTIGTYEAHQIMALLYMCYYGNINGQAIIGTGSSSYKVTGQTNIDGMNDTVVEKTRSINFWGLENWWGNYSEWIDNLITYNNTGGVSILNYDGNVERQVQGLAGNGGTIRKMLLGEKLDMIPTTASGTSSTSYYCDQGKIMAATAAVGWRSGATNGSIGGPFYIDIYNTYAYPADYGSRLQYQGRVTILK